MRRPLLLFVVVAMCGCAGVQQGGAIIGAYKALGKDDCGTVYGSLRHAEKFEVSDSLQSEISFIRATCLGKEAKYEEALAIYHSIVERFPDTEYAIRSKVRIKSLTLNEYLWDNEAIASEIGPEPRDKIERLMRLTGAKALGKQIGAGMAQHMMAAMKQSSPDTPPRAFEIVTEVVNELFEEESESLFDLVIPLYAKYFSEADIDVLIAFYSFPTGRRIVETMPALMQESLELGSRWSQELAPKIAERVEERLVSEGFILE